MPAKSDMCWHMVARWRIRPHMSAAAAAADDDDCAALLAEAMARAWACPTRRRWRRARVMATLRLW